MRWPCFGLLLAAVLAIVEDGRVEIMGGTFRAAATDPLPARSDAALDLISIVPTNCSTIDRGTWSTCGTAVAAKMSAGGTP